MALELKQQFKLSQQLVITPQLQQAIKLLQLSQPELVELVEAEMLENPLLEEETSNPEEVPKDPPEIAADRDQLEGQDPNQSQNENQEIGGKEGDFKERNKKLLSEVPMKTRGICIGVKDSSATFLKFLDKHHIALGQNIQVLDKEDFDNSLLIEIGAEQIRISHQIASNLYIKLNE